MAPSVLLDWPSTIGVTSPANRSLTLTGFLCCSSLENGLNWIDERSLNASSAVCSITVGVLSGWIHRIKASIGIDQYWSGQSMLKVNFTLLALRCMANQMIRIIDFYWDMEYVWQHLLFDLVEIIYVSLSIWCFLRSAALCCRCPTPGCDGSGNTNGRSGRHRKWVRY